MPYRPSRRTRRIKAPANQERVSSCQRTLAGTRSSRRRRSPTARNQLRPRQKSTFPPPSFSISTPGLLYFPCAGVDYQETNNYRPRASSEKHIDQFAHLLSLLQGREGAIRGLQHIRKPIDNGALDHAKVG